MRRRACAGHLVMANTKTRPVIPGMSMMRLCIAWRLRQRIWFRHTTGARNADLWSAHRDPGMDSDAANTSAGPRLPQPGQRPSRGYAPKPETHVFASHGDLVDFLKAGLGKEYSSRSAIITYSNTDRYTLSLTGVSTLYVSKATFRSQPCTRRLSF